MYRILVLLFIGLAGALTHESSARSATSRALQDAQSTEIRQLITDLANSDAKVSEKAKTRLEEIGVPALDLLQETHGTATSEATTRVASLIRAIRTKSGLPSWVNGMEFKLIVDKEWIVPSMGKESKCAIQLQITNTMSSAYRLHLADSLKVTLKDAAGRETLRFNGYQRDTRTATFSEPLSRNQKFTIVVNGRLSWSKKGKLSLSCTDMFSATWIGPDLEKAAYEMTLSFENKRTAHDELEPVWIGAVETLPAMIVLK